MSDRCRTRAVYFSTNASSRKARNLVCEPRIVVHNGDGRPRLVTGWEYATCAYRTDWACS